MIEIRIFSCIYEENFTLFSFYLLQYARKRGYVALDEVSDAL
jgi:hypothetical protein